MVKVTTYPRSVNVPFSTLCGKVPWSPASGKGTNITKTRTNTGQPSKRVLTAQGQRTHDRIVAAAAELMHRHGVRATSLDDVLHRCGAGKSQMYHYFASKQELLIEVIGWQWELTRAALGMTTGEIDSWSAVRRWLYTMIEMQEPGQAPQRCPLGSLASELAGSDEAARTRLDVIFGEWAGYLADGLEKMKARGLLQDSASPTALAMATLASVQGGILLAHTRAQVPPLRTAVDAAYEHLRSYATVEVG